MAGHLVDTWYRTVAGPDGKTQQVPRASYGKGSRYRVRYLGPDGREKSKSFPDKKKREALAFLASVQTDVLRGSYVDPNAGRITFQAFTKEWMSATSVDEQTMVRLEYEFRLHVLPQLGHLSLSAIHPSTIRAWGRQLQEKGLAASYRRVLYNDVSMVFNAAVDDKRIASSPFAAKSVRAPTYTPQKVIPWNAEQRIAMRSATAPRYRICVDIGAGCGLRQGEIFGLSPDDIDRDRRIIMVRRQIKIVRGRLIFALPKGRKTREVPLPRSVADRLDHHAEKIPPVDVTLPFGTLTGEPVTVRLLLSRPDGSALERNEFNLRVWKPTIRRAGIEDDRRNGMHVLRHTYASVLLDAGESIKALASYLGHTDPGFTLRVYTHLLPSSEDRTRRAIDAAFDADPPDPSGAPDGMSTA
ncbi:tyrosine-type recombinase/integrase [Actinoplanes sp. NBRC 103695]|uniref:tyrosine-type recombinase/integrase n=1 Tax=Actinoplanes sp. NBRC 103695 TaxID=3032202 RepID=UPI0024A38094|nr:tyrosine-type recombinase/integrase [Actinoplanes sp. NBRC 103695]GLZ00573.1 hypothetical protein Acsp02_78250 [Actinoplanes sp. NBRC 103695]